MGFSSFDALINAMTVNGTTQKMCYLNKITTPVHTAAGWHAMSGLTGWPVANTYPGASLAWVGCSDSAGNGTDIFGIQHGGNVSPATKHVINVMAEITAAAGLPGIAMLVDLQGYYKLSGADVTSTTSRTLTGTPSMRYTNGVGCFPYIVSVTQPTAGGPTISASSYTNSAGTTTRAFPGTPVMNATANAYATRIIHSGQAAGNYAPFLPLQAGDTGVASIQSFTFSAGTAYTGSGVLAICIARPLLALPITTSGLAAERDLVNQLPSMPQIKDGACLEWLLYMSGATTNLSPFIAAFDCAWN